MIFSHFRLKYSNTAIFMFSELRLKSASQPLPFNRKFASFIATNSHRHSFLKAKMISKEIYNPGIFSKKVRMLSKPPWKRVELEGEVRDKARSNFRELAVSQMALE